MLSVKYLSCIIKLTIVVQKDETKSITVMFKINKHKKMEELITQFNRITGNAEWSVSIKYLTLFRWNVKVSKIIF